MGIVRTRAEGRHDEGKRQVRKGCWERWLRGEGHAGTLKCGGPVGSAS